MVVVKRDVEARRVCLVQRFDVRDMCLWRDALFLSRQHNCRAVCVVSTDISAVVTTRALKANPDVRLHLLEHVPQMQWGIGVGKSRCDENLAR